MSYTGHSTPCFYVSATTKNAIIDAFARDKKMLKEIQGICRTTNTDDLMQMIYLYLLEKPDELIIRLNQTKQLKWYVINMVRKQFLVQRSPYNKLHKISDSAKPSDAIMEVIEESNWNLEECNETINKELDKLHWYDKRIFLLVANNPDKTTKELESEVNIKWYSILYSFNRTKNKLKNNLKKI